ncbi:NADP-dependent phosphogluconate dehydrogenase [Roseibacterium sp. SDUM158016]|uniref:NADP-dependent phosphogluconate dehydrogenase n=1 Tax=Roseicyclus sediminis TaxID=2980997 RepID=UPI0021D1817D|nr:NADP-dependent phosphogluconate dehydrogenase [Roseibacterium sp. SDUM158016]MCU4655161.1 NADP-dependent phosphogluconate dehydrogenase [Roseibacterium sp. SDUM158016]
MTETSRIGLIGLGTMGANLALNIAEAGHRIAVFNRTAEKTRAFHAGAGDLAPRIVPTETLEAFTAALEVPRTILLMVPAGSAVDDQIAALAPYLSPGDILIDGGNSDWQDSRDRAAALAAKGLLFLGLGVSGGAEGARHGPSLMAGGAREAWQGAEPVLASIAARFDGVPCAALFGEGGAGHYVKTVHNGIEYADMQMIAEVYGLMRDGQGRDAAGIAEVFAHWNKGPLESYLVEIAAEVAATADPGTGRPLLDVIADRAGQKGTGRWTVIDAQRRAAPLPAVEAAVTARVLSGEAALRAEGQKLFAGEGRLGPLEDDALASALLAGKVLAYSQGFTLLERARQEEGWSMPLDDVARTWRAGCIIRWRMLDDMAGALAQAKPGKPLAFAPAFAELLSEHVPALRKVVSTATLAGLPVPALSAALQHFDQLRQARGTANMIQGLRDRFGRHGFERLDRPGESGFHGPWADGED